MQDTKTAASPGCKDHQRTHNSDSASASSNDEKNYDSDTSVTEKDKVITPHMLPKTESWDSMCEESENEDSGKERHIRKSQSI
jgi:hypothetical protein